MMYKVTYDLLAIPASEYLIPNRMESKFYLSISIYIYTASPPRDDYVQVRVSAVLVEEL